MIVRIVHEGQFEVSGAHLDELNQFDNQIVEAVATGDESGFRSALDRLLESVRSKGKPVPIDEFRESAIILPPADATMEDVQHIFSGEGIIPEHQASIWRG